MTIELPAKASLSQLRTRAKDLRKAVAKARPDAIARVRAHHPEYRGNAVDPGAFTLRDAQLTIAREHGMSSWGELMEKVATDTYLMDLTMLEDMKSKIVMSSVMGVEAQHLATLRAVGALLTGGAPELIKVPIGADLAKLPAAAGSVARTIALVP